MASAEPTPAAPAVLTPETLAVLACAQAYLDDRARPALYAALRTCPDAGRLCACAVAHGMLGHLHLALKGESEAVVAGAVRDGVAELYRASAERALRQTSYLLQLIERLRGLGIEAMPIKGPAWAERLYGDVTLRNWVDLDLVVDYELASAVRDELLAMGCHDWGTYDPRILERAQRTEGEVTFWSPEGDMIFDIHWQVGVGYSERVLGGAQLLGRARAGTLLGRPVPAPSREDLLLMTCLHGARHRWHTVEALLALAVQVRRVPAADWSAMMSAARAAGCVRIVSVAVAHVCHVFSLRLPVPVAEALAGDAIARTLLRSLTPESLMSAAAWGRRRQLVTLLWRAAGEDSLRGGLEHAALRTLRPGPEDWQAVRLPPGADWAYWLLRPPRLALKWARRFW